MALKREEQAKLDEWINAHAQEGIISCPNCKSSDFSEGRVVRLHPSTPIIMQKCNNCQYVRFMDAKGIGIV